jgi:hypothetical protein
MNKLIFGVGALLVASTASAGVRIETISRDIKTQVADGPGQTVLVQDGKIRVSTPRSDAMILKNGALYMIDDKKKVYREMDKASMKRMMDQAGAAMQQIQDQLKDMTPEQRAQMEKMMGGNMPGMVTGKKDVFEAKDTGKNDTAEGRKCRVWTVTRNGQLQEELCVVPFSSLPGKEDMEKSFKEMAEAFQGMASAVPGAADSIKAHNAINGYPVRTRFYDNKGQPVGKEQVLKTWAEESVPASAFEVPAGYKKEAMPKMGG